MEIKQCEFCRMPYQSIGKKICGDCFAKLDEDFITIREYLYEHDRAGIEEVSEATGVSRKSILYLLKEERLLVGGDNGDVGGFLKCESCKKPINTGRMCASCKKQIISEMNESISAISIPKKKEKEVEEDESMDGVAKLSLKGR